MPYQNQNKNNRSECNRISYPQLLFVFTGNDKIPALLFLRKKKPRAGVLDQPVPCYMALSRISSAEAETVTVKSPVVTARKNVLSNTSRIPTQFSSFLSVCPVASSAILLFFQMTVYGFRPTHYHRKDPLNNTKNQIFCNETGFVTVFCLITEHIYNPDTAVHQSRASNSFLKIKSCSVRAP